MRKGTSWPSYLLPLLIVALYGVWLFAYDYTNPSVRAVILSPAQDLPILFEDNWQLQAPWSGLSAEIT